MKVKQLLLVVLVSMLSAFGGVFLYGKFMNKNNGNVGALHDGKLPANYASFLEGGNSTNLTDFSKAAESAIPAVVHIKTKIAARQLSNDLPNSRNRQQGGSMEDLFNDFFGGGGSMFGPQMIPEQRASGSGVIISQDGYIVTNNHVVSDGRDGVANEIKVTLNDGKKTYTAKVVGRDASTDLAVIKIEASNLPYMIYGNSDEIKLGQWVLAVGYPLNLEATVTAGIVSAKGRALGINSRQSQSPVESFIQTDAAVNQGNSGGALINTAGQLIGINSAILAPTGAYVGYSFAIPVTIVKKIVNDIIEFGNVKRGFIGVSYAPDEQNDKFLKQAGITNGQGVYVSQVPSDGGAAKAGLKKGDVIIKMNDRPISRGIEISGLLASSKPGDGVKVTYIRGGKEYNTTITLTGEPSKVTYSSKEIISDNLGVDLENVDSKKAAQYKIPGGVRVVSIKPNGPLSRTRIEKDFVITGVNNSAVKSIDDIVKALQNARSSTVILEGIYPGFSGVYQYQINLDGEEGETF